MENSAHSGIPTKAGTIGGTLFILLLNITSAEVLKTAVLAAVGASVSFGISYLLNKLLRRRRPR